MSYCRAGDDSDVYVIKSQHVIVCVACVPSGGRGKSFATPEPAAMIGHLLKHRAKGDKVPERAIERLKREAGLKEES